MKTNVEKQLQEMQKAQKEQNNLMRYESQKLDKGKAWLLFLLLGWSYGYRNQMGKQIFFYLTLGGLGLWTLYVLFTLNSAIERYNTRLYNKIVKNIAI